MNRKLKYPVVTIGREYCAYGRTVSAGLAERLGIEYYEKDFVNRIIAESGFSEEVVWAENEAMSRTAKFLEGMLSAAAVYSSSYDKIFDAQKEVVLELAKNPCILLGRCANSILKNAGIPRFSVYLYADMKCRKERCAELTPGLAANQLEKHIRKVDTDRQIFYKKYAGSQVSDPHNYNVCLDVGALGVEKTIETIYSLVTEDAY